MWASNPAFAPPSPGSTDLPQVPPNPPPHVPFRKRAQGMVDWIDRDIHKIAPSLIEPPLIRPVGVVRGAQLAHLVNGPLPDMERHHLEESGLRAGPPPECGEKGPCRRLQFLFVLPHAVGRERAHGGVGDVPARAATSKPQMRATALR